MHRGRIQVQGTDLSSEISWAWASDDPPTEEEGLAQLGLLRARLSPSERALREVAFQDAERFIRNAAAGGGKPAFIRRTFRNPGLSRANRTARVDIDVFTGKAFVP